MTGKTRRFFYAFMIIFMLVTGFGCATTASVGAGYYAPVAPHGRAGIGFGIGF